jgi:acyl-coenzyme A thioesterase PaaI-like protein
MTSLALATALRHDRHGRLDMLPYARALNLSFERDDDETRLLMPFAPGLIGAPGRLHGGTLAGLLEMASLAAIIVALPDDGRMPRLRPITITTDFMREGTPVDTHAAAEITRLGRRIANVSNGRGRLRRRTSISSSIGRGDGVCLRRLGPVAPDPD